MESEDTGRRLYNNIGLVPDVGDVDALEWMAPGAEEVTSESIMLARLPGRRMALKVNGEDTVAVYSLEDWEHIRAHAARNEAPFNHK